MLAKCFGKIILKSPKGFVFHCQMLSFSFSDDKCNDRYSMFLKGGFFFLICKLLELRLSLEAHNSLCSFKCRNYFKYKFKIQTPSVT